MTNAEKLAKDIEALAFLIHGVGSPCKYCIYNHDGSCGKLTYRDCLEGVKNWLKQEAKEND